MHNRYLKAFVTSSLSIIPIIAIVLILSATPLVHFGPFDYALFCVGGIILIIGLTLFQVGAARGLTKVGEYMGQSLSKQNNLFIVILFSFVLGVVITCAEPSILIVVKDICSGPNASILKYVITISIALGVGLFIVLGIIRILKHRSLKLWYLFFYALVFMMICIMMADPNKNQFLPFIFDSGGITTGSATVPFILSLGAGIATVAAGKNSTEDSFGLVGMASIGPVLTMTLYVLIAPAGFSTYEYIPAVSMGNDFMLNFLKAMFPDGVAMGTLLDVLLALTPIIVIFLIYQSIYIKLPKNKLGQLMVGFLLSYVGLVVFLTGTGGAMGFIGKLVGQSLGNEPDWIIILLGFVFGMVTILCEPAVHVLTNQIESISDGHIKKTTVLLTLSLGVGLAICLSFIRTIYQFSILYIIVPGYLIAFALMFICPNIFTAIAFDSGGTASGPMSTSFILPMIIGIAYGKYAISDPNYNGYYNDAFGVVALIALTPVIAVQILGVINGIKQARAYRFFQTKFINEGNNEIIHFQ